MKLTLTQVFANLYDKDTDSCKIYVHISNITRMNDGE